MGKKEVVFLKQLLAAVEEIEASLRGANESIRYFVEEIYRLKDEMDDYKAKIENYKRETEKLNQKILETEAFERRGKMTVIRVLVPAHLEQWFMELFPKAIKKRIFKSDKLDYVEYFILEFSIFDLETLSRHNLFWKYDNWPQQFWE